MLGSVSCYCQQAPWCSTKTLPFCTLFCLSLSSFYSPPCRCTDTNKENIWSCTFLTACCYSNRKRSSFIPQKALPKRIKNIKPHLLKRFFCVPVCYAVSQMKTHPAEEFFPCSFHKTSNPETAKCTCSGAVFPLHTLGKSLLVHIPFQMPKLMWQVHWTLQHLSSNWVSVGLYSLWYPATFSREDGRSVSAE